MTGRRGGRIFKVEEMSRVKAVGWGRVGPVVSALGAGGRVAWASWSRSPGAECNWMLEEGKGLERAEGPDCHGGGECVCVCVIVLCTLDQKPQPASQTLCSSIILVMQWNLLMWLSHLGEILQKPLQEKKKGCGRVAKGSMRPEEECRKAYI